MYASQKFQGFCSLRRPETHSRHAQGHQRAGALTGSINIFQSTVITVYEVEHQKTVNTKLGKDYLIFRSNQRFLPLLLRKRLEDTKRKKVRMHCIPKAYQSILQNLQNPMAKEQKHF